MKVLVFGATGFIGLPVCRALVRLGHIVYGQTRSRDRAASLAIEEIVPLVCDPFSGKNEEVWHHIARQADVVIDVTNPPDHEAARRLFNRYLSLIVHRPLAAPRPTYIYTGGLWSNTRGGSGLDSWTDERQPRSGYLNAVRWRSTIEDPLLLSEAVNGVVIRPGIVYGYAGSFIAQHVFQPALKAGLAGKTVFETLGRPDTRWASIHVDDAADLFARIAERGSICKGQTFLAINNATERQSDVLDAVVRVSAMQGWKLVPPKTPYDEAWASTTNARPSLGRALVGWEPRKPSLADGMDVYWEAFLASVDRF